jgi:hypothetical protein
MNTIYRQSGVGARLTGIAERPKPIPERVLWQLWKKRAALQEGLRTEAGRHIKVLYPGRAGTSAGPDFLDALLEIEGLGVVMGDVELYLRQRDWAAHGHSSDPNYNGVVVHGALQVDTARPLYRTAAAFRWCPWKACLPHRRQKKSRRLTWICGFCWPGRVFPSRRPLKKQENS